MYSNKKLFIKNLFNKEFLNKEVEIFGWVSGFKDHSKMIFIQLSDGSNINGIQLVFFKLSEYHDIALGCAIKAKGRVVVSKGSGQDIEISCTEIHVLANSDESYPVKKHKLSNEYLRSIPEYQHRTKTIQSITKIKHEMTFAIHQFLYKNKFINVFSPILTTNSCEGGSDVFHLDAKGEKFFGKKTTLSVSGQFYLEAASIGLQNTYILSPAFRAENSNTSQHLAEFWMLEIEMHNTELNQLIEFIYQLIKEVINFLLENCQDEFKKLIELIPNNKDLINKLENFTKKHIPIVDYSETINQLNKNWGEDISSEDSKKLTEEIYKSPIFIINYPKKIKSFYMKQNEDNKTVACLDLLFPIAGEVAGGSARESNFEKLKKNAEDLMIDINDQIWYINLRKYGYYSSAGFGLGIERLLMWITGINNTKETILFPRYSGHLTH